MSIVIAIDGGARSGKGTLARMLAGVLDAEPIHSGDWYRAVTNEILHQGIDPHKRTPCEEVAQMCCLGIAQGTAVAINGRRLTASELHSPAVDEAISAVAAYGGVREVVNALIRKHATRSVVVEGRDIGTTVLPEADLKIFLVCESQIRASRGGDDFYETVAADLERRDRLDSGREHSPLAQAEGALVIDTADRSVEEEVRIVLNRLIGKLPELRLFDGWFTARLRKLSASST